MKKAANAILWLLVFALAGDDAQSAAPMTLPTRVERKDLCVTEGVVAQLPRGQLSVDTPRMRAYFNRPTVHQAEARFTYLGGTESQIPLGSSRPRRQFGLKLRAQDACNLVYAMWRFEPKEEVVVSVKRNAGQHASAECANHGYINIQPDRRTAPPAIAAGQTHTLRAELDGARIEVHADGTLVWEGSIDRNTLDFDGPVGMRSDNVRLRLELRAGAPAPAPSQPATCRTGSEASEK